MTVDIIDKAALVDVDEVAQILGIAPHLARSFLESRGEAAVATYHGRPLWLADTVHDVLAGAL